MDIEGGDDGADGEEGAGVRLDWRVESSVVRVARSVGVGCPVPS